MKYVENMKNKDYIKELKLERNQKHYQLKQKEKANTIYWKNQHFV